MFMMNKPCVAVKDLEKFYHAKPALAGITLNIQAGEIFGLVGPNGAGKTTFLKLLMGLVHPTGGTVKVFDRELSEFTGEMRREVGYVAEEPNLYEFMTLRELAAFTGEFYPGWDKTRCRRYLEKIKLPVSEKIKNFSRGMKTRTALVLALLTQPRLLLLDEPLEGLDPISRREFLNLLLEEFTSLKDRTVIISSHHLVELERICDRVGFLKQGRLFKVAPMELLKGEAKTIRVVFQKEPPAALFHLPGIKKVQQESKLGFLLTVEDNFSEIYEACSQTPHFVMEVYHRNLEELFREYAGGGDGNGR